MGKTKILSIAVLLGGLLFSFNNCSKNQFQSNSSDVSSSVVQSPSRYLASLNADIQSQTANIQNSSVPVGAADIECQAQDLVSWKSCLTKAHSRQINRINVTGPIYCEDSSCALSISSIPQFKIIGSGEAAFVRSRGFDIPLFKFISVNLIIVSGIKVFESANRPVQLSPGQEESNAVCLALPAQKCASTLEIYRAQSVQVTQSYFVNGKVFNAIFWGIDDLQIQQSRFDNAFLFGIWGSDNKKITLSNSIFQKNRSNAFLISFTETEQALVSENIFDQNHHATAFHVCGASRQEPCPGGQIDLLNQVRNVTIEKNKFFNSRLSGEFSEDLNPNLIITGVEFEPHSSTIQNVKIDSNYYENNNAGLFYLNMPNPDIFNNFRSEVIVSNNNYCQMPRALFNFAQEYQWKSQIQYSNNAERCISGMKVVPVAPVAPQNRPTELVYAWQLSDWGSCSAMPAYVYSNWSECAGGQQSRTAQCSGQSGQQTRTIRCQSSDGQYVADSMCATASRPIATQSCSVNCSGSPQLTRACTVVVPPEIINPPPPIITPPPSSVSGTISGSDCQLQVGQSTCTATVQWSVSGAPGACVFANGTLFACEGESSSKSASWIVEAGVLFELKASNQVSSPNLASRRIFAISPYTLTGSDCQLNGNTACTSLISWKAPGFATACVFANGALFACEGENSNKSAPWISSAGVTFELRQNSSASSTLLKKIVVKGK